MELCLKRDVDTVYRPVLGLLFVLFGSIVAEESPKMEKVMMHDNDHLLNCFLGVIECLFELLPPHLTYSGVLGVPSSARFRFCTHP